MKKYILFSILCALFFTNNKLFSQCCDACTSSSCLYSSSKLKNPTSITESGSMSKSKSGKLIIKDSYGNWSNEYYYIYAYQYAYIYRGNVGSESHSFSFSGFLDKGTKPILDGVDPISKHMIYKNEFYSLKIPYKNNGKIYFKQKGGIGWQCISN